MDSPTRKKKKIHEDVPAPNATVAHFPHLWKLGLESIRQLETEQGILASAREEAFGCIFGRDSLITALSLMSLYEKVPNDYLLALVEKILVNVASLQGVSVVLESGEEPGKIIHEYRPDRHEHLTRADPAWYLYEDGIMRNYDSVDSTPLFLMAVHRWWALSCSEEKLQMLLPSVRAAISWMLTYADSNKDGFIDYTFASERSGGGLRAQSWMDSEESVFFEDRDEKPTYPIAPVEVQAYSYVALEEWGHYFIGRDRELASTLLSRAELLHRRFNGSFVLRDGNSVSLAYAIEGQGRPLTSARSSMGHVLWARDSRGQSIIDATFELSIARRLLMSDLYVPGVGIRTLSSSSSRFALGSYHNGSIWPHDTAIVAEGLEALGLREEARDVRQALVRAYEHFKSPIELFTYGEEYGEYESAHGQKACKTQAWSAAALLSVLVGLGGVYTFDFEN